jgi:signal peptidase I
MDSLKKEDGKVKKTFKKVWFLLWKDNSIKGWLFSMIFLFIFIKLIFFPFLNLVTGTALPLAIVESCSMYHSGNVFSGFDSWFNRHETKYEDINLTKAEFQDFSMRRGFSKGDILFIIKANPEKLKIGDIIVFNSGTRGTPIIHRIVSITDENGTRVFSTMGDNNNAKLNPNNNPYGINENRITSNQLVGKAVFRIAPWFGWVKLIFFEASKPASERGFCSEN